MAVFVLDAQGRPLMPCAGKRARLLLERGRARIHRMLPFVIRLVDRQAKTSEFQVLRLKLDPGSKTTGLTLVREALGEQAVLNLFELMHRGRQISEALTTRSALRRRRRGNLRYRAPRFLNRTKPAGWLAPSLQHRVDTTLAWVIRLSRWAPISALSSNLGLACGLCNQAKGSRHLREFLAKDPKRLAAILAKAKHPLRDAAAVNSTRWALVTALKATGLAVETASGGKTKFNRCTLGVPKTHALDAACVGAVPALSGWSRPAVTIKCNGRGTYQRTRLDTYGFPRGYLLREKTVKGFQTGDHVVATVPTGKTAGAHVGRVAIRRTGSFNIQTLAGVVQGISYRHCRLVQRGDGYGYGWVSAVKPANLTALPANGPRPLRPKGVRRQNQGVSL